MSRTSEGVLRLAASRSGGLLLSPGAAALAASERWQPAGTLGCPTDVYRGCAPEAPGVKCRLKVLYVLNVLYIEEGAELPCGLDDANLPAWRENAGGVIRRDHCVMTRRDRAFMLGIFSMAKSMRMAGR